jgi:hypothetical protein
VLRNASSFFRDILSLPQPASRLPNLNLPNTTTTHLFLEEDSDTIELMLRLINAMEIPNLSSLDRIESLLHALEKYGTPGPMSIVRQLIILPIFLDAQPIRVYALCSRYGWLEQAGVASTSTLAFDLLSVPASPTTSYLDRVDPKDLLRLLRFHRSRRDAFELLLEDLNIFSGSSIPYIAPCGHVSDDTSWKTLKLFMVRELERKPNAETIAGSEWWHWPETDALQKAKCTKCGRSHDFNMEETHRNILQCIERLPKSILVRNIFIPLYEHI